MAKQLTGPVLGAHAAGGQDVTWQWGRARRPCSGLIEGGPGTGKSTLLAYLAASAREAGFDVVEVDASGRKYDLIKTAGRTATTDRSTLPKLGEIVFVDNADRLWWADAERAFRHLVLHRERRRLAVVAATSVDRFTFNAGFGTPGMADRLAAGNSVVLDPVAALDGAGRTGLVNGVAARLLAFDHG